MSAETPRPVSALEGTPRTGASVERLVDALGMAWSSYTLYEDPLPAEAFKRAVDTLGKAPAYPRRLDIAVDGFTEHGEPVPIRRDSSIRLARRMFGLGVASIELRSPPTGEDLVAVFGLCGQQDPPEDPIAASEELGIASLRLLDREMLVAMSGDAEERPRGRGGNRRAEEPDDGPGAFVMGLLLDGTEDPADVARRFVEEYERAHGLIDPDDVWSAEELIRAFVDGFWYLPEAHRAAIFSLMLERRHREENTAFLDQFGSIELAEMNRMFGERGHPLLSRYLEAATRHGSRHGDDLEALIAGPAAGPVARRVVDEVSSVLHPAESGAGDPVDAALTRIRNALPGRDEDRRGTVNVLRSLFLLADGPTEIASAANIWAARVAGSLEAGDPGGADDKLSAATELDLGETAHRQMLAELAAAMKSETIGAVARLLTDPTPDIPGAGIRELAPHFVTDPLVRELAIEQHPGRHRILLAALGNVARTRPEGLLRYLEDDRPVVVRDIVIALGDTGDPDLAPSVRPAAGHPDPLVRAEALRTLHRLEGSGATDLLTAAAADADATVAFTAGRLLGRLDHPDIEASLLRRVSTGEPVEAESALAALAGIGTATARAEVGGFARRKLAWWGRARRLKLAAKRALELRDV